IAEQALRIAHAFVTTAREDMAVEPGHHVGVFVEQRDVAAGNAITGDGNVTHDDPVADESADEDHDFAGGAAIPQIKEAGDEIADGDALQHAVDAQVSPGEGGKAVDEEAEA